MYAKLVYFHEKNDFLTDEFQELVAFNTRDRQMYIRLSLVHGNLAIQHDRYTPGLFAHDIPLLTNRLSQ